MRRDGRRDQEAKRSAPSVQIGLVGPREGEDVGGGFVGQVAIAHFVDELSSTGVGPDDDGKLQVGAEDGSNACGETA